MSIQIKGYIATSADGYIATPDGSVAFLAPFQSIDCGYDDFIQDIDIVIMGRKTYEVICLLLRRGLIQTRKDLSSLLILIWL